MAHPDSQYTVLKVADFPSRFQDEEVILAQITNPSGLPYVTWRRRKGHAATFLGEYFESLAEAEASFNRRRSQL